jgi:hypothetical protein
MPRKHVSRSITGVNRLAAASFAIASSRRSRRPSVAASASNAASKAACSAGRAKRWVRNQFSCSRVHGVPPE